MTTHTDGPIEPTVDAGRVQAIVRLAFARMQHPELSRREAEARLDLAAAIIAMDEAEDRVGRHNLHEQAAVNSAQLALGEAIADLIRGEADSSVSNLVRELPGIADLVREV